MYHRLQIDSMTSSLNLSKLSKPFLESLTHLRIHDDWLSEIRDSHPGWIWSCTRSAGQAEHSYSKVSLIRWQYQSSVSRWCCFIVLFSDQHVPLNLGWSQGMFFVSWFIIWLRWWAYSIAEWFVLLASQSDQEKNKVAFSTP